MHRLIAVTLLLPLAVSARAQTSPASPTRGRGAGRARGGLVGHRCPMTGRRRRSASRSSRATTARRSSSSRLRSFTSGTRPWAGDRSGCEGDSVKVGPFAFTYDRAARTLTGTIPEGLAPVYKLEGHAASRRAPGPSGAPRAQRAAGAAGVGLRRRRSVVAGHLLRGRDRLRRSGGRPAARARCRHGEGAVGLQGRRCDPDPRRARGGRLYFQADDGIVHALDAATGAERWRTRLVETPIVRLPPSDPKSRFDRFGSDVTVVGDRLFVGTHAGRVVCLDAAEGRPIWQYSSGDSVLAAPAVDAGRVYFGSYDGSVQALDASTGALLWKRDTGKPVVSTPAIAGDRVVVGSRSYDLLGLDAKTGEVAWKRYLWFSWVESSPVVRDGIAYVGSSDAAALYAFDARTGRPVWKTDVWGWAWGQPAVSGRRVYIGTSALGGYIVGHQAGLTAVEPRERAAGVALLAPPVADKAYGFTGSTSLGGGRVFASGLDGRVYAFPE